MQKFIWLLAFLPCLPWLGSSVNGATVLTSTSDFTRIAQSQRLDASSGIPTGIRVIDKERGAKIPDSHLLFKTGVWLMANFLARDEFYGSVSSQAWSSGDYMLGVSVYPVTEKVQRAFILYGFYFIFLLMKQEHDFRSGVFEVVYGDHPVCALVILPFASSGLKLAPSFAHVTHLDPPPLPIPGGIKGSSQTFSLPSGPLINLTQIQPLLIQPMDVLGELLSSMDMMITAAQSPVDEIIQNNIASIAPNSGVNVSLSLAPKRTANAMTYGFVISTIDRMCLWFELESGQGLRGQLYNDHGYLGEITMLPSNSAPTKSPLVEAIADASAARTATARKKRSMPPRLWNAGRS